MVQQPEWSPEMPTISPDNLNILAAGVVVWVVALSVAFSFYVPMLRAQSARRARLRRADTAILR